MMQKKSDSINRFTLKEQKMCNLEQKNTFIKL
jgi:hypothetical protein